MGIYITFEGIDGCGKSTQIKSVKNFFYDKCEIVCIKEPGEIKTGFNIREKLLNNNRNFTKTTEICLFLIDRAETFNNITKNKLSEDCMILSDRGLDSLLAYQDVEHWNFINMGNDYALQNRLPDLTFYLDIPVEVSQKRLGSDGDYYDLINFNEKEKIRSRYLSLVSKHPNRIVQIDGTKEIEKITKEIVQKIEEKLYERVNLNV